jgi:bifunctional DNase/RNase
MNAEDKYMRCNAEGCAKEAHLARIEVAGHRVVREDVLCQEHGRITLENYLAQDHVGTSSALHLEGAARFDIESVILRFKDDYSDIYVREVGGRRLFQWRIGYFESLCIRSALKNAPHARPMTHEVPAQIIGALGGVMDSVVVDRHDELNHAHRAQLRIRHGTRMVQVDVRPSDALAIAIYGNLPFFISEELLAEGKGEGKGVRNLFQGEKGS